MAGIKFNEPLFCRGEELKKWIDFLSEERVEIFDNGQEFRGIWIPDAVNTECMYELRPKKCGYFGTDKTRKLKAAWQAMEDARKNIEKAFEIHPAVEDVQTDIGLSLAFMSGDILNIMKAG